MIPATYIYHAHADHWGESFAPLTKAEAVLDAADCPPAPPRQQGLPGRLLDLLPAGLMRPAPGRAPCPAQ
jgi:hypothetical protein